MSATHAALDFDAARRQRRSREPIRPFTADDIPQVADLHRRVFDIPDEPDDERWTPSSRLLESYQTYFDEVFLNGPWKQDGIHSLVYEDDRGKIVAFLGVVPRRMLLNDEPVWMAVCTQFIVDPKNRGLAGLQLKSAHLEGPQDLSVTDEANEATRRIWAARGGETCLPFSIHWVRPIQPARLDRKSVV